MFNILSKQELIMYAITAIILATISITAAYTGVIGGVLMLSKIFG